MLCQIIEINFVFLTKSIIELDYISFFVVAISRVDFKSLFFLIFLWNHFLEIHNHF